MIFFTRIGQQRDDGPHVADPGFRELEQIANVASSTMDRTDPCRENNLLALSRGIFVDIHDMVWAVSTVEIDDFCHT